MGHQHLARLRAQPDRAGRAVAGLQMLLDQEQGQVGLERLALLGRDMTAAHPQAERQVTQAAEGAAQARRAQLTQVDQ